MARSKIIRVFGLLLPLAAYIILGYTWYVYNVRLCGYELIDSGRIGQAIGYLIPINVLFILSIWSYFRAIITSPGSPNHPYTTRSDHSPILPLNAPSSSDRSIDRSIVPSYSPTKFDMNTFESKQSDDSTFDMAAPAVSLCKQNGQPRYCEKCQSVKPDRTHHCSECDECVLKMDHHCPWVNGCVGFRNYKYFLLFIIYTSLYALFGLATTLPTVISNFERLGLGFDFHLIILDIFAVLFGILLTVFAGIHIFYTLNNTTTIESIADQPYYVKVELLVGSQVVVTGFGEHLWGLGSLRRNWESLMGRVWWKWFLPLDTTPGTGLTFPYHPSIYSRLVSEAEQENRMPALMTAPEAESYSESEYQA